MRTFVAIDPGAEPRAWLEGILADLSREFPGIRWVKAGNVHLTLRFLGEVDEDRIPAVIEAMEEAARGAGPLTIELGPPGWFGPRPAPRTFWLALAPGPGLERLGALQERLERGLAGRGFPREDRPWKPHVTIGRNPRRVRAAGWEERVSQPQGPAGAIEVEELDLLSSELGPGGPVYRSIARRHLGAGARE